MSYQFVIDLVDEVTRPARQMADAMDDAVAPARRLRQEVDKIGGAGGRLKRSLPDLRGALGMVFGGAALAQVAQYGKEFIALGDNVAMSQTLIRQMAGGDTALVEANKLAASLADQTGLGVGQALDGIAKMLPLADKSVAKTGVLVKLARALGNTNPAEGFEGAAFALKELESGDAMSLRERFNIRVPTQEEAKKIAKKTGKSVREVLFGELNRYLDDTYGKGQQGAGVDFLLTIDEQSVGGQWKRMMATVKSVVTPIALEVLPLITEWLKDFNKWLKANMSTIKKWAKPIAIATGLLAGLVAVGSAIAVIGPILAAVASPVGLVVVAVAALAAAFAWAWKESATFRGVMKGLWGVLQLTGGIVTDFLVTPFKTLKEIIVSIWTLDFPRLKSAFSGIWDTIKETGKTVIDFLIKPYVSLGKVMTGIFTLDKDLIMEGVNDSINLIKETVGAGAIAVKDAWNKGVYSSGAGALDRSMSLGQFDYMTPWLREYDKAPVDPSKPPKLPKNPVGDKLSDVAGKVEGGIKHITVNIENLVRALTIQTTTLGMSESQVKAEVSRILLSVVNDVNYQ